MNAKIDNYIEQLLSDQSDKFSFIMITYSKMKSSKLSYSITQAKFRPNTMGSSPSRFDQLTQMSVA